MEDTYYFSQGRLISAKPYDNSKNEDTKNNTTNGKAKDSLISKLFNLKIYNKSILRYNL
jgi:hypothetical protein